MAILNEQQLKTMGFKSVGENVRISNKASFYNCEHIEIGNNVRIDDFCVIASGVGGIEIGNYVHIAIHCSLIGAGRISLKDFSGISSRVSIYSSSDDYSGASLTNPTVPDEFKNVYSADVILEKHVIIGSGSVLLPGITLKEGVAVGALSLVNKDCESFGIYAGNPAKRIKDRKRDLLNVEQEFIKLYSINA